MDILSLYDNLIAFEQEASRIVVNVCESAGSYDSANAAKKIECIDRYESMRKFRLKISEYKMSVIGQLAGDEKDYVEKKIQSMGSDMDHAYFLLERGTNQMGKAVGPK